MQIAHVKKGEEKVEHLLSLLHAKDHARGLTLIILNHPSNSGS